MTAFLIFQAASFMFTVSSLKSPKKQKTKNTVIPINKG